jgi:uncharacterized membrane protein
MRKTAFIQALKTKLAKRFPEEEINNAIGYYNEIIEERILHGEEEEEVIGRLGSIDSIASIITTEIIVKRTPSKSAKDNGKNFLLILAICTSPVLLPIGIGFVLLVAGLLIAFIAVVFALFIAVVSIAVSLFPIVIGLIGSGATAAEIILAFGLTLLGLGVLSVASIKLYETGVWVFSEVSRLFTKVVNKKIKENK